MERKYKGLSVFAAILISAAMLGGCDLFQGNSSGNTDLQNSTAASETEGSEESEDSVDAEEKSSEEPSEEESSEVPEDSIEESGDDESSEISEYTESEESSEDESVQDSSEISEEKSSLDGSQEESEVTDGYQFDDEEIVTDYHNPEIFTSNEEFNKIFSENALDTEYNEAQKDAVSSAEMLNVTSTYAIKWKDMADTAYNNLYDKLSDRPTEQSKLAESQENWQTGIEAQETLYENEAQEGGTESLLASQAELMNRYKSRAAVLFEQIYELDGTITLSAYGL